MSVVAWYECGLFTDAIFFLFFSFRKASLDGGSYNDDFSFFSLQSTTICGFFHVMIRPTSFFNAVA